MRTNSFIIFFFILLSNVFAQTNLIENWDGNGDINTTTSYPDKYGWDVTNGTFNYANSSSGIRWSDVNTSSNPVHYLNNGAYSGRLLMIRWDGAGSTALSSVYSYPVTLQAGKRYKFSWNYEWWNNASVPTYTVGVGTTKDGLNSISTNEFVCSSDKNTLTYGEFSFFITGSGTYYLTIKANNLAVLGGIGNLSIVEIPRVLESNVSSINLNYYNTEQSVSISPNATSEPINILAPAGIKFSPTTLPSSGGTFNVSSADSTSLSGNITVFQGDDIINIPVNASFKEGFIKAGRIDTLDIDGAWCWFADPRALYHKGEKEQTYFSWVTGTGDIVIATYNHQTGEYKKNTLSERLQVDDHANPSIFIRKDGKIILFYSKHFDTVMRYRISTNAEDITSFGTEKTFGYNVTYPYPFQVGDDIVVFYRGDTDWHPIMAVSHDNGETFETQTKFIVGGGQRPYTRYSQDPTGAIHVAFTTGHPRNEPNNKIYYACFKDGKFYKANGSLIKDYNNGVNPLNIDANDAETVYNASGGKGWIWDITVDSLNKPVMVFAAFPLDTDHRYHYARWTGTEWYQKQLTNAGKWFPQTPAGVTEPEPNYSGGISLDYDDPSQVYLSKQVKGVFEILKFSTPDGGVTWDSTAITWNTPPHLVNVRPIVPRNHKPGFFDVLWMRGTYTFYTNYHTSIVFQMDSLKTSFDRIELNPETLSVHKGTTSKLNVSFYPAFSTADKTLSWSSSDENVATVNNGVVTGISVGKTTITATTSNGKSASMTVNVLAPEFITNALFDFGMSTSPVVTGGTQVTESTFIGNSYGWLPNSVVYSRDRGAGANDLLRDFLLASTPATFAVFVPNGNYRVIIQQGDLSYAHDNMSVSLNGILAASGINSTSGTFTTTEFEVTVTNEKLEFTFADNGGSDANWVVNSLEIRGITNSLIDDNLECFINENTLIKVYDSSGRLILNEKLMNRNYSQLLKSTLKKKAVYMVALDNQDNKRIIKFVM